MTNASRISQVVAVTPVEAVGNSRTSQFVGVVVIDQTIDAPYARTSQGVLIAPVETDGVTRTSQAVVQVVYGSGSRENFSLRAWAFFLDGNWFYVLHLGLQGTWVYSLSSDSWFEWITAGYDNWNAEQGLVWNGWIVAGDNQNGILWEFSPDHALDDDFREVAHKATALIPASARQTVTLDGMWLTASIGYPAGLNPLLQVRISDDYGQTWITLDDCDVTLSSGNFTQEIAFRSLGSFGAPGRVIEVSDIGGPTRIDRAFADWG